ncbi:c-type cytochrome [Woodsholea maritima]|uniref:c-type cytochrome n=1 Tax=Woodsholea maritima TaxID=240237 RepID=UPI000369B018|nr:c-type cytochrome [Woodsholea maritima]
MGDLFWNKVAGAILALLLVIMGIRTFGDAMFHVEDPEDVGYPVDLSAMASSGGEAEEDAGPVDYGLLLASADVGAGERVARRCASCHTFEQGGADMTGPHLWGVVGREIASASGFNYSDALKGLQAEHGQWLWASLDGFLESPRRYAPGTAMSFAGLRDQQDRINLIAYLRTLSDSPVALPAALPSEPNVEATEMADAAGEMVENAGEAVEAAAQDAGEAVSEGAEHVAQEASEAAEDASGAHQEEGGH